MEVDGNIHILAHIVTHSSKALHHLIHHLHIVDGANRRNDGILHYIEAFLQSLLRNGQHIRDRKITRMTGRFQMAIHADSVTAGAAQHLMDRHIVIFALDVPQSLLDTGNGTAKYHTAAIESPSIHQLPKVLDLQRICTDQHSLQFMYCRFYGLSTAFQNRLTPADNALVCFDFQKHPSGLDVDCF